MQMIHLTTRRKQAVPVAIFVFLLVMIVFIATAGATDNGSSKSGLKPRLASSKYEEYVHAKPAQTTTTTTSTTAPKRHEVKAAPPKPVEPPTVQPVGDDIYLQLAACESGDPTYNGPSGFDGAFQFLPSTWNSMNTGYAFAYEAPFEIQLDAAKRLIARSGWSQFPMCARKLGML